MTSRPFIIAVRFRLQGYNYSRKGAYFVTICAQNRQCVFGNIVDNTMQLNEAGNMICRWHAELESKLPDIECDAFVCMPNHVHFVVVNVGAALCVRPDPDGRTDAHVILGEHTAPPLHHVRKAWPWHGCFTLQTRVWILMLLGEIAFNSVRNPTCNLRKN